MSATRCAQFKWMMRPGASLQLHGKAQLATHTLDELQERHFLTAAKIEHFDSLLSGAVERFHDRGSDVLHRAENRGSVAPATWRRARLRPRRRSEGNSRPLASCKPVKENGRMTVSVR